MIKELVLAEIKELPDDASIEDIIETVYIAMHVQKGLEDVKNGNVFSHEEVLRQVHTWIYDGQQNP